MSQENAGFVPYVKPEERQPEITLWAVAIGIVLAVVMCAANVYLGLRAGMTVSASIPAAVISMAIMRGLFRRGTILENNIAQTIASTGESIAAGAIFTIPALVMTGVWGEFEYWPTTLICMLGGLLGVIFMIPMRRALIVNRPELKYPEGVACAEVLIAGQGSTAGARAIIFGVLLGGLYKLLQTGFGLVAGKLESARILGGSTVYSGLSLSPALVAVGYIVNLRIASLIFLGGALGWVAAMPLLSVPPEESATGLAAANYLYAHYIKYIGVGAMLVGGIDSIIRVRKGIWEGVKGLRQMPDDAAWTEGPRLPRTDRDMTLTSIVTIFLAVLVGVILLYMTLIGHFGLSLFAAAIMTLAAFLFVAVASYIVGLVGSSNSPVSGMTICTLLIAAGLMVFFGIGGDVGKLATLGVAGVMCCAACTAGDISQDLKTGYLVGATPYRQQWMEVVGAIVPAFFVAPILTALHAAHPFGAENSELSAPQATLFANLTEGVFGGGDMHWGMVGIGVGVGLALIVLNALLHAAGFKYRAHLMPVAVGMYLPFVLSAAIFVGGLLRFFTSRASDEDAHAMSHDSGILFGSGIIAGESLMGIALALAVAGGYALPEGAPSGLFSGGVFLVVLGIYAVAAHRRKKA